MYVQLISQKAQLKPDFFPITDCQPVFDHKYAYKGLASCWNRHWEVLLRGTLRKLQKKFFFSDPATERGGGRVRGRATKKK